MSRWVNLIYGNTAGQSEIAKVSLEESLKIIDNVKNQNQKQVENSDFL